MDNTQVLIGYDTGVRNLDRLVEVTDAPGVRHLDLGTGRMGGDETPLRRAVEICHRQGWTFTLNKGDPMELDPSPEMMAFARDTGLCKGVILDECDWGQINAHWVLPQTEAYGRHEQHPFVDTEGMGLQEAYEAVLAVAAQRNHKYVAAGLPGLASEHLFPAMMHVLARAGFAISPKVLKETWGPAMLAVAIGAAKQYGTDLWVDVDEWWHPELYGHPLKRYESALRLAYWMGASVIYSEGGRFSLPGYGGIAFPKPFVLSAQGRDLRRFATEYVPEHPRPYSFRDVRPTTAIIRFDDSCFDIRQRSLGEYPGPLYGHIPAAEANAEWLIIWNLLSHGYVRTDSLTHNWETKLSIARSLFAPLNNVVVYDHLAADRELEGLQYIFLSGIVIPPATLEAVQRRVRAGATCVTPLRFLPEEAHSRATDKVTIIPDGRGKWVIPHDFYWLYYETWTDGPRDPTLRAAIEGALGPDDCLQYTFGEQQLRVRMHHGDPDLLEFTLVGT